MIGARFDLKRLFKQFNSFGGVALVQLEYSLVIKSIHIARTEGRARETLFANRQIGANASYNLSLVSEFRAVLRTPTLRRRSPGD